jgi:hypothetical protein
MATINFKYYADSLRESITACVRELGYFLAYVDTKHPTGAHIPALLIATMM